MSTGKEDTVKAFLSNRSWVEGPSHVSFLAAGEYNENYLVASEDGRRYVFRINHGSQLGLKNQIAYEFQVLENLSRTGVTPRPFYYEEPAEGFGAGVLLMEYLPGRPLDYAADTEKAADIFAKVHSVIPGDFLIEQAHPVRNIANECDMLLHRYPDHPLKTQQKRLLAYHDKITRLADETESLFRSEPLCLVNSEVNSGNFIIEKDRAFLVDWEKAVKSPRYQDLGHFIVLTTTRWKTDYTYTMEEKVAFIEAYAEKVRCGVPLDELIEKTFILEKTILLRGLSWCFMAYYEYTRPGRELRNEDTFEKIKLYMNELECILP